MEHGFDLLEEKVRKAADLVKRLRKENKALEDDVVKAKSRLQEAERRLASLEKEAAPSHGKEAEGLSREIATLRHEREEIRKRIAKLVDVLDIFD
jgi:predicted RNase H-like nuclease (RuvC/YqgF family)